MTALQEVHWESYTQQGLIKSGFDGDGWLGKRKQENLQYRLISLNVLRDLHVNQVWVRLIAFEHNEKVPFKEIVDAFIN